MRPLLFGSGKAADRAADLPTDHASMRPLLFGSGKRSAKCF